ncbi:hypothetical protein MTsPCn9_14540 [Croceitalea sp. MTPC9]|nr:hypothetical protein MTsPCn6_14590 [Croceitalea sp. MTPC6]GMN16518.1 hypothetical protein MTsPCn9_14540 [Croceitalea sp. MTPC9]
MIPQINEESTSKKGNKNNGHFYKALVVLTKKLFML